MGFPTAHKDPTDCNESTAQATLGAFYQFKGDVYRYIQNGGASASTVGNIAGWHTDATVGEVTMVAGTTIDTTLGTTWRVAGVWVDAITAAYYGYILVAGEYATLNTDGNVGLGDALIGAGGATPTFIAAPCSAGKEHAAFGISKESDDSTNIVEAVIAAW